MRRRHMSMLYWRLLLLELHIYPRTLPAPQHVHVAWATCLVCEWESVTFESERSKLVAALDEFTATMGTALLPSLCAVAEAMAEFARAFSEVKA